jgi:hypothetical protein
MHGSPVTSNWDRRPLEPLSVVYRSLKPRPLALCKAWRCAVLRCAAMRSDALLWDTWIALLAGELACPGRAPKR